MWPASNLGAVEGEAESDFGLYRVRKLGSTRTLVLVQQDGQEFIQSSVDLKRPGQLLLPYSRFMFASYLFRPEHEHVLLVGLGGGAMVHFLSHHDPDVSVDVVEIDPVVVDLASKYFQISPHDKLRIFTADAFVYLRETVNKYDVIYLDAFLDPLMAGTDIAGIPIQLTQIEFYEDLKTRLVPGGVVVSNQMHHGAAADNIKLMRQVFSSVCLFRAPYDQFVAVASTIVPPPDKNILHERSIQLDRRFHVDFSFSDLLAKAVP